MTLYRQLTIMTVILFALMFVGTLAVNFHSTRLFLMAQLESHAQDTATSLGLSLSPHMADGDMVTVERMIDAIFDRGYYREILLTDPVGGELAAKRMEVVIEGVPRWFIEAVDLGTPRAEALVMAGWRQGGVVEVWSHPGYAYNELWSASKRMFGWFAGTAAAVALLGALALHFLLKPLRAVEHQADEVAKRHYEVQEKLPRTRELRSVVSAMNRMTMKIKTTFEEQAASAERLREIAFLDPLTGLGNRRYFDDQLKSRLAEAEEAQHGVLMLIHLHNLQPLNDRRGFEAGDALVKGAGAVLVELAGTLPHAVVARLGGADFALLAGLGGEQADALAERLCDRLAELHGQGLALEADVAHIGAVLFVTGQSAGELLAAADQALRTAQSAGPNRWHRRGEGEESEIQGRQAWRKHLEEVIGRGQVLLYAQPVAEAGDPEKLMHREVLVRIPGRDGEPAPAGLFLPMAEELGLARHIDRLVVEGVIAHLARSGDTAPYAINLSPSSLRDEVFLQWLLVRMEHAALTGARLVFEFTEAGAVHEIERLKGVAAKLRDMGHAVGLDHFGRGFSDFGYLQSLQPEYVKIDAAYTRDIGADRDKQFFIRTLAGVAHSLDVYAIAERVESEEEWRTLRELHVDGVQGYLIGRPQALENGDTAGE